MASPARGSCCMYISWGWGWGWGGMMGVWGTFVSLFALISETVDRRYGRSFWRLVIGVRGVAASTFLWRAQEFFCGARKYSWSRVIRRRVYTCGKRNLHFFYWSCRLSSSIAPRPCPPLPADEQTPNPVLELEYLRPVNRNGRRLDRSVILHFLSMGEFVDAVLQDDFELGVSWVCAFWIRCCIFTFTVSAAVVLSSILCFLYHKTTASSPKFRVLSVFL